MATRAAQKYIREKKARDKERAEILKGFYDTIKTRADAIADGWIELTLKPEDDTQQEIVKLQVARIPFERWMRNAINHRRAEWHPPVCPLGLKMHMDDRNHSDWWLSSGIPIDYSYTRHKSWREDLEPDDPDYVPQDPDAPKWESLAKRLNAAAWEYRFNSKQNRERNSMFLVSSRKKIEGRIVHIRSVDDIPEFVEDAQSWKRSAIPLDLIAVVPDCSILYDAVIRNAAAIITQVGSKAAHLVKVAREDRIPVIMCPDAFKEFFEWERVSIENKSIRGLT